MSQNTVHMEQIVDKFSAELKKRLSTLITRLEKRLVKEIQVASKTSRKPKKDEKTYRKSSESESSDSSEP